MNAPEINMAALAEVRTALEGMKLKHACDGDIMAYPEPFKGLLLRDGYIDYDIRESGITYKWTPGTLDLVNGEPEKDAGPIHEETEVSLECTNGIELSLMCRFNEAYDSIEVIPRAKYTHMDSAERRFSTYSIMLRKDVSTMPDGVYGLYIEIPGLPQGRHPLCLFTYPAEQLGNRDAEHVHWTRTDQRGFACEQLGIEISLDDSTQVDRRHALRAVLDTDVNRANDGIALVTLSMDELPNLRGAHAVYLESTSDPLMDTHTENALWHTVPED